MRKTVFALGAALVMLGGCDQIRDAVGGEPEEGAATGQATTISFNLGNGEVQIPAPEGFCVRDIDNDQTAALQAQIDVANDLVGYFERCGEEQTVEYVLVKIPRDVPTGLTKDQFLDGMEQELSSPEVQAQLDKGIEQASRNAGDVRISGNDIGYRGRDEDCIYIGGNVQVVAEDVTVSGPAATCLTAANGQAFSVSSYDHSDDPVSLDDLKARSRAVAASLTP
ncbi:hypothetical protein [Qipengyuania sp. JC766]|uniref:hypothetical protein n=1 Tax=Qipengyuania sp. JC766 TaxID=3232139 RepID=UPI00345A7A5E